MVNVRLCEKARLTFLIQVTPFPNLSNTFSYQDIKCLDAQKFVDELNDAPQHTAFVFEDTDDVVDSWYKIFSDILDSQIPVKVKRVKNRAQPNWFTTEINDAMRNRDKLLKKARISESSVDWANFKRAKNEVCKLISEQRTYNISRTNLLNINIILKDCGALSGI